MATPFDPFARQRVLDEDRFAIDVRDATSVVIEIRDVGKRRRGVDLGSSSASQQFGSRHAAKNS
jgi:hypothetical protein